MHLMRSCTRFTCAATDRKNMGIWPRFKFSCSGLSHLDLVSPQLTLGFLELKNCTFSIIREFTGKLHRNFLNLDQRW